MPPRVKNIKFKTWNKKQKKNVSSVGKKIERVLGMDLANQDILFHVFRQLDPISLCSCSMVATFWYKVASFNYLWELVLQRYNVFPNYRLLIPEDSSQILLESGHHEKWRCAQIILSSRMKGGRLINGTHGKADMRRNAPSLTLECSSHTLQQIAQGLWHLSRFDEGRQGQALITTSLEFSSIFWKNLLQDAVMTSYSH
eukprot:TRINITY_DN1956_c0_g1_i3.p1 TRINITY_DN1956_c0_g1~~TRINITY_DN1956_c0_g1_i3.p1  ORF type:complete len:199 (+),score=30.28 TRINITY_DN1956_c0_g1_i3:454-1050(+)